MQNKRFIIIISIVATIILIAFGFLFYYSFQKTPAGDIGPAPIELTDFGTKTPSGDVSEPIQPSTPTTDIGSTVGFKSVESNLIQVTNLPVIGATVFEQERLIEDLPRLSFSFTQDLKVGDKNPDVKLLQIFLNSIADKLNPTEPVVGPIVKTGIGSIGREGDYFGEATKKTLIKFQNKYSLTADGIFSETTRAKINELLLQAPEDLIAKLAGPQKNTESVATLRYVDRLTGNIYEAFLDEINGVKRVTSTQIFGVQETLFSSNGRSVALRYLKDDEKTIESFLGTTSEGETELKGYFLPENVVGLSASPDSQNIFYLFKSGNNTIGINSSIDGSKRSQVFTSAFSEWLIEWPNQRIVTLATKPSYAAPGYLYSLNPSSGSMDKIIGGIAGLTTKMSPNANLVLYTDNSLSLNLYNLEDGTSSNLGIKTLPEKCVWSLNNTDIYCAVPAFIPLGNYPDSWYQGDISFNDLIWRINLSTGASDLLTDPTTTLKKDMDAINLFLDSKENTLFFTNKKDSIFWSLDIKS